MNLCKINKMTANINKSINYRKKKIDGIKIMKNKGTTKKQIDNSKNRLFDISDSLIYTNNLLNVYRKNVHANKVKNVYIYYITLIMKVCLYQSKNQFELLTNEIHSIRNNTPVPVKVNNFIGLEKNYVLLNRDMEIILKKFQHDQFLKPSIYS